jgi:hypothetical protein
MPAPASRLRAIPRRWRDRPSAPTRGCDHLRVASSIVLEQRIGFFDFEGRKVAYSLVGEGPLLVFPPWWISHIELEWQQPGFRSFFGALVETHTVLRYDRLGV